MITLKSALGAIPRDIKKKSQETILYFFNISQHLFRPSSTKLRGFSPSWGKVQCLFQHKSKSHLLSTQVSYRIFYYGYALG